MVLHRGHYPQSGLSILCADEIKVVAVKSQLQQIARPMYSNPPLHGALIVSTILHDPALKNLWLKEVKGMADRIIGMEKTLKDILEKLGSPLSSEHITNQIREKNQWLWIMPLEWTDYWIKLHIYR